MAFNHTVTIAFTVISEHESGEDITAQMLKEALLKRVQSLNTTITRDRPEGEWIEAVGAPFDSYKIEDN